MSQLQSTSLSATLKINNLPLDGVIRFLNLVTGLRVVSWAEALLNIKTFKVSLTLNFSKCSMWPLSLFQRYQISHWMQTESVSVLIDIICVNSVVLNLARIWRSAHVSKNLRGFNNRAVTYKHIFKLLPWHFNSVCLLMPVHQQHISAVKKEKNNPMHKKHTWFFFFFSQTPPLQALHLSQRSDVIHDPNEVHDTSWKRYGVFVCASLQTEICNICQ